MKRFMLIGIACVLVLMLSACGDGKSDIAASNKEEFKFEYKVNPDYSDKLSGQVASDLIAFYSLAVEYDKIAFESEDISDSEKFINQKLTDYSSKANQYSSEYNDYEKYINKLITNYGFLVIGNDIYKSGYQVALVNKELGVTDKQEYLDIESNLKDQSDRSKEILNEFSEYLVKE